MCTGKDAAKVLLLPRGLLDWIILKRIESLRNKRMEL
jgi:hypothetical protein